MKTYNIYYTFDGVGNVSIPAESRKEAEGKFYDGPFTDEKETGFNYEIIKVELKRNK